MSRGAAAGSEQTLTLPLRPLEDWLREENARNGVRVGWDVPDYSRYCKEDPRPESAATSVSSSGSLLLLLVTVSTALFLTRLQ